MDRTVTASALAALADQMAETRRRTLTLADAIPVDARRARLHPYYSPFDWHLGHVGMTEAYWVLDRAYDQPPIQPDFARVFENREDNPKEDRVHLPSRKDTLDYLTEVRSRTLALLAAADLASTHPLRADGYCFRFVLAHEWQHQETMMELIQLANRPSFDASIEDHPVAAPPRSPSSDAGDGEICVPAGWFRIGTDDPHAYDNERPSHDRFVPAFALDETPVTVYQFSQFIAAGGYDRPELWPSVPSEAVRDWKRAGPQHSPRLVSGGPDQPVCGVNWHEASAYARWIGKRLPTEAEWEKAAAWDPVSGESRRYPWGDDAPRPDRADFGFNSSHVLPVASHPAGRSAAGALDMAGGVWEWTGSLFEPYPGFKAFPYEVYSVDNFDGNHYVLKGGSWATQGPLLRCAFRNFYPPEYRHGFVGFRCARTI